MRPLTHFFQFIFCKTLISPCWGNLSFNWSLIGQQNRIELEPHLIFEARLQHEGGRRGTWSGLHTPAHNRSDCCGHSYRSFNQVSYKVVSPVRNVKCKKLVSLAFDKWGKTPHLPKTHNILLNSYQTYLKATSVNQLRICMWNKWGEFFNLYQDWESILSDIKPETAKRNREEKTRKKNVVSTGANFDRWQGWTGSLQVRGGRASPTSSAPRIRPRALHQPLERPGICQVAHREGTSNQILRGGGQLGKKNHWFVWWTNQWALARKHYSLCSSKQLSCLGLEPQGLF